MVAAGVTGDGHFSVAASAVVTSSGGEVLLARRRGRQEWVLAGSRVEEEEAPWDAVAREVREETGLEIDDTRLVGVYVKPPERDFVFVFRATARSRELRTSEERDRVAFVNPDQLPNGTTDRDAERIHGWRPSIRVISSGRSSAWSRS
jgi:8-oxo-dGTP pyrophosphatase MutT (NUDIX family)